jgi:hypothetical protein
MTTPQLDQADLARQLDESLAEGRAQTAALVFTKTAIKAGFDAQALADSGTIMRHVRQLDPDAPDFGDAVAELLRAAAQDPRFRPAPAAAQPVPEPQPEPEAAPWVPVQPGELRQWTQEDYDYWTAPRRDPDGSVVVDAIHAGLLAGIGVGRARPSSSRRR